MVIKLKSFAASFGDIFFRTKSLISLLRLSLVPSEDLYPSIRRHISPFNMNEYKNSLYIRFEVKDKPGVLSEITQNLAKNQISIQRMIQIPNNKLKTASIVIITHTTRQNNSNNFLKSLKKNKEILKRPVLLRLFD